MTVGSGSVRCYATAGSAARTLITSDHVLSAEERPLYGNEERVSARLARVDAGSERQEDDVPPREEQRYKDAREDGQEPENGVTAPRTPTPFTLSFSSAATESHASSVRMLQYV